MSNSSRLTYTLTEDADVEITVFDLLGRRQADLVNGHQQKGQHWVDIDALEYGLIKGDYILSLKIANKTYSKKLVVLN